MKNTTIRLVTVAVVVVMGAFALALAQHDSRLRNRETDVTNAYASGVPTPLVAEGDWGPQLPDPQLPDPQRPDPQRPDPQRPDIGEPAAALPVGFAMADASQAPDQQRWKLDAPSHEALPSDEGSENPLRAAANSDVVGKIGGELPSYDALPSYDPGRSDDVRAAAQPYEGSAVVAATAEGPLDPPQLPPAWLAGTAEVGDSRADDQATQQLPPAGNLPSLPTFPIGPQSASPSAAPSALPNAMTEMPRVETGSNVSLGQPQLPTSPASIPPSFPTNPRANADLSDTQRGAMPATEVGGRSRPGAAQPPPSYGLADGPTAEFSRGGSTSFAAGNTSYSNAALNAAAVPASLASLVSDAPGTRYLDGSQNPILLIQKRAPEECQVGKPLTVVFTIRNAGNTTAHEVTVVDVVPRGTQFVDANPPIRPASDGLLTWQLGEMAAGDERTISLQLLPQVEGEIGSLATVSFAAQASMRTVATQSRVEVTLESSADVLIGGTHQLRVVITNRGTGLARGVRLEADIPPQLRHESGESLLDAAIGDLRPNESKKLNLVATAIQPGTAECIVRAVNEDGILAEQKAALQVNAPQLVATIEGPGLRYLERQATYRIKVQNTGTAAATNLDFVVHLPKGLKFISADIPQSSYDPKSNTVSLGLYELAAGQTAPLSLSVLPVETGVQVIKFNASADLGVTAEARGQVQVDGLAELAFTIGQDNGTVEVGASSTYSVQISNVGNQTDKQVQLVVQLPQGAELLAVDAPVEYRLEGQSIIFNPMAEVASKDQHTYRFQVRHTIPGNQVVRTQMTSANWPVAVVKEEGTLVYNDQN